MDEIITKLEIIKQHRSSIRIIMRIKTVIILVSNS